MSCFLTGLGMVTAVGHTASAACAAIRAGVSRPREFASFPLLDEIGGEAPLHVHPVHGFAEGFQGVGRWIRLAQGATADLLRDVRSGGATDPTGWRRSLLLAVVPEPDERFLSRLPMDDQQLARAFVAPLLRLTGLPIPMQSVVLVRAGDVGVVAALAQAKAALESGYADQAVVVAVDSLIEPFCLSRLSASGRLKGSEQPAGLAPGEAGVALLLERQAAGRGTATVRSAVVGMEAAFEPERNSSTGQALTEVIRSAVQASAAAMPFAGDWITSLNGEVGPAAEMGFAVQRLIPGTVSPSVKLRVPCSEVGYTGAAAAAIGCGVAMSSFARGYASGEAVLVTARGDEGSVGAAVIGRAN